MKRYKWAAGIAALAAAGLLFFTLSPLLRPETVQAGAAAPELRLSKLKGGLVSLSDYRGRVLLLNFWATWCPGCVEELPALEKLYKKHEAGGLSVLAASLDEKRDPVAAFVEKLGLTFPIVMADAKAAAAYRVAGLPMSYLIGSDGVVRKRYAGVVDPATIENDILGLLHRRKS
jgi:peroxiredoxin